MIGGLHDGRSVDPLSLSLPDPDHHQTFRVWADYIRRNVPFELYLLVGFIEASWAHGLRTLAVFRIPSA